MSYIYYNFIRPNEFNNANRLIVIKMESKLDKVLDKIKYKTNPDKIFIDEETYTQVTTLLEDIDKLWDTIKNHSDNMKTVYYTLIQIEDLININTKNFEEKDSTSKFDSDSSLSETIKVQKKKKG